MVSRASASPTTTTGQTNQSTSGNQVSTTIGSSNTSQNSSGTQSSTQQNISNASLSALESLISGLSGGKGGDPFALTGGGKKSSSSSSASSAKAETAAWQAQIGKLNQVASDYSKDAAFADSDAAVQGALSQALQKTLPTITAGIQAAGTSGSAMSALLAQQAAEDASYNAAQLGINAAISYGQIQSNSLSAAGNLITSGDPAMNQLLSALGIAKGAVSTTNSSSSNNSSSNTNSAQTTTAATNSNTNTAATQTSGITGTTKDTTPTTSTTGLSSTGQNWYTPSSYQSSGANSSVNSYSQFQ